MSAAVNESKTTQATQTAQTTTTRLISEVSPAIDNADSTVAQGVQTLTLVHQARLTQLTRTAANISAQYGATSVQAKAANAAVTISQATVARLSMLQNRVTLATPTVPAKGWAVYGHVYHSTLKAAAAYTVFFVDEQNAYQADIGFAYTAADGSFQLSYTPGANATSVPIFFEVVNAQAQPVYLSSTAFQPQTGAANYLDVTLPSGEPVLGDPPVAIRAIAMPEAAGETTPTSKTVKRARTVKKLSDSAEKNSGE